MDDDETSAAIPMGFDFPFAGTAFPDVYVRSNGFVNFDGAEHETFARPMHLGEDDDLNSFIAFWWSDLNPDDGGTISYETQGVTPDQVFVLDFTDVPFFEHGSGPTAETVTVQLHLHESGLIEVHVTQADRQDPFLDSYQMPTVGVESVPPHSAVAMAPDTDNTRTNWAAQFLPADELDKDGDGSLLCDTDCDDTHTATPGALEICDGSDNDCNGSVDDGFASEVAGHGEDCPALDCAAIYAADNASPDGLYWVDFDDGGDSMRVWCDMTTDGGGWMKLQPYDVGRIYAAEYSDSNPAYKCEDDLLTYYPFAGLETDLVITDGGTSWGGFYFSFGTYDTLTDGEEDRIQTHVTQLSSASRLVASTADDDNYDLAGGSSNGHEAWIEDPADNAFNLSPGTNGNCGGSTGWPAAGSQSAFYLWSTTAADSEVAGITGLTSGDLGALPAAYVLPDEFVAEIETGGGVTIGWEEGWFLIQ